MKHEITTAMFSMLYRVFSCSKVKQIRFMFHLEHYISPKMKHETGTIMFTTLYKAFSCSKVKQICFYVSLRPYNHRNGTRNQNRNVYNALQGFFVFQSETDLLFFRKKTLLGVVDL